MVNCDLNKLQNTQEGQLIIDPITLKPILQKDIRSPRTLLIDHLAFPLDTLIDLIFRKNLINNRIPHPIYPNEGLTTDQQEKLLNDLSALLCIPNKE
jgi:hypothetical protein